MVLQNYQNLIEMTSNMINIVAFGGGLKCPRKILLNTQCPLPQRIYRHSTSSDVNKCFLPYRKTTEEGFIEVFEIWLNKKRDRYKTAKITVQGTCCWEIYHRSGASQKDLKPGQTLTPSQAYISMLKTKKC